MPLTGVKVELYCSNDPQNLGELAISSTTNSEGWYELVPPSGCKFFNIRMVSPSGHNAVGAASVSGNILDKSSIQYVYPIKDLVLTGNKFWAKPTIPTTSGLSPGSSATAPQGIPCQQGCRCLPAETAQTNFGSYERCSSDICGYDQRGEPQYCFRLPSGPEQMWNVEPIESDVEQPIIIGEDPEKGLTDGYW